MHKTMRQVLVAEHPPWQIGRPDRIQCDRNLFWWPEHLERGPINRRCIAAALGHADTLTMAARPLLAAEQHFESNQGLLY